MKLLNIILIFILILTTLGCVEQVKADNGRFTKIATENVEYDEYLVVYHDNVNNVTIYTWQDTSGYGYSGMSAIPDWQIKEPVENK